MPDQSQAPDPRKRPRAYCFFFACQLAKEISKRKPNWVAITIYAQNILSVAGEQR